QAFDLNALGDEEREMLKTFRRDIENETPITEYHFSAFV
ncbi:hypothetical protein ABEQ76_22475, partial [Bacillus velezensis]